MQGVTDTLEIRTMTKMRKSVSRSLTQSFTVLDSLVYQFSYIGGYMEKHTRPQRYHRECKCVVVGAEESTIVRCVVGRY